MPGRPALHGMADYRALVTRSLAAVRPVSFDFHAMAVDGDRVLCEWTIALEVREDGMPIVYRGMSSCVIDGERITSWREYYDPSFP
jgi:limonene-1,2-epoxide hydrolase